MAYVSTLNEFPFDQVPLRSMLPVAELTGPDYSGWLGGEHGCYPVEISYEKFHEWVWRVRSWRVQCSATVTTVKSYYSLEAPYDWVYTTTSVGAFAVDDVIEWPLGTAWSSGSGVYAAGDIVSHDGEYWVAMLSSHYSSPKEPGVDEDYWRILSGAGSFAGAQELMLVCTQNRPLSGSVFATGDDDESFDATYASFPDDPTIYYDTNTLVTLSFMDLVSAPPVWKRHGSLWLPRMDITVNLYSETAYGTSLLLKSNFPYEETSGLPDYDTVDATIDGYTVPLQYESAAESSDDYYSIEISRSIADWSCVISPYEWYEFDPGDGGGPVWDSADGSELRNRYSIQAPS